MLRSRNNTASFIFIDICHVLRKLFDFFFWGGGGGGGARDWYWIVSGR